MKKRRQRPTNLYDPLFKRYCYLNVSRTKLFNNNVIIEITIEAIIAVPNPSMTNDEPIIAWVIISVTALMTNKNKPNDKTVIGSVKKIRIGFIIALIIDNTILARIAVPNPSK